MKLTQAEFTSFQKLIFDETGISLNQNKINLVQSRLFSRLHHHKIKSFSCYLKILNVEHKERIVMSNLITTNETYFFRESSHFEFLAKVARNLKINQEFRVWSAASSVGAEAYSIAMVLDNYLTRNQWEVVGTDINTEVIQKAKKGLYPESWIAKIPTKYKTKYCLKGRGRFEGEFIIDRSLIQNVHFTTNNLTISNKTLEKFDIIFLRNVLLYFNQTTKQQVLNNILDNLKMGGYFIISLTENLDGLDTRKLKKLKSSIYKRIG